MAGISQRTGGAITGINVTPLVDITLVLLIIFMVTARLVAAQRTLPMDLPKAASGEVIQEILSVELDAAGQVRLDGTPLSQGRDVIRVARERVRRSRELRAVIQADGSVPHRQVIHVLDELRQAGIVKVGFGVAPAVREP